jgi:hypothetical protein
MAQLQESKTSICFVYNNLFEYVKIVYSYQTKEVRIGKMDLGMLNWFSQASNYYSESIVH